jgi:hypothetical protein
MPRNKIKQDFHFTTLKRLKIIINKLVIDSTMTKGSIHPVVSGLLKIHFSHPLDKVVR